MAKNWFTKLLFDWVFELLCRLMQGLLHMVSFIESFFDIFAGTAKVMYKGGSDFLINIFFGHDAVTNAFWAMALIAIVMAFAFCIVGMARKATDVTGTMKQSVGQIFSSFIRCLLIILLINAIAVASINITNVLLDRINFALENAAILDREEEDKHFSDQEYAAMARVLATVANYSVNPSADSRYNINSCFNAIRNDLLALHVNGFFDYDYGLDENGHHTWQSALNLLATSADLTNDLNLSTYYSDVAYAVQTVSREISTYKDFAPVQTARVSVEGAIDTDVLIFLIAGMDAAQNGMYNNGAYDDALRRGYITGEKDYMSLKQVRRDFDLWEMDYLVAYISSIVFILIMAMCIFTFIVRMFNLLLLYLVAPLFASSMPLDDGSKWQSWTQAFVIQLFSGFGSVIAMRLYLIIIPIILSSDLIYFPGTGTGNALLNRMAQLLMVLGGAWAVLQASGVITGILAGNPGMAAIQQEGRIGGLVTQGAMSAVRGTKQIAGGIVGATKTPFNIAKKLNQRRDEKAHNQQMRAEVAKRKATKRMNKADKTFEKADKRIDEGKYGGRTQRLMDQGGRQQRSALKASAKADKISEKYGLSEHTRRPSYTGFGGGGSGGDSGPEESSVSSSGGSSAGSGGGSGFIGTPRRLDGKEVSSEVSTPRARTESGASDVSAASAKSGSGSDSGFIGTPRTLGGGEDSGEISAPRARTENSTSDASAVSAGSVPAGGSGAAGTAKTPDVSGSSSEISAPRARATSGGAAPASSGGGSGFTGTPRTIGGGGSGFTGTPRTIGGSGSGFTGTPRTIGGGGSGFTGTPRTIGGGDSGFTGTPRSVGGGGATPASSSGGAKAPPPAGGTADGTPPPRTKR